MSRTWHRRAPLLTYFALAYGFSWLFWSPIVFWFPDAPDPSSWALLLAFVGAYGPSAAAIATVGFHGGRPAIGSFLRQAFRWRVGWKWYALAFFVPPAFLWIGALAFVGFGGSVQGLFPAWLLRATLILGSYLPFGPLGEELGWRGYALPRFDKRWSPLVSSVLLGLIWVVWHVPMFWVPGIGLPYGSTRTLSTISDWSINVMSFSILLSFAARKTCYSVPIAILLHATLNAASEIGLAALVVSPSGALEIRSWAPLVRWLVVLAAAVALARDGKPERLLNGLYPKASNPRIRQVLPKGGRRYERQDP